MESNLDRSLTNHNKYFFSKNKYKIDLNKSIWQLNKDITVNVEQTLTHLYPQIHNSFLKTLSFYAQNLSANHTLNVNLSLLEYLRLMNTDSINTNDLISYRFKLNRQNEHRLGILKGFLKKWHELGYEGVSDEVIDLLNGWTLKGNIKGDVVKRLDPHKGPLTDIELLSFNEGSVQAFEQGKITVSELAIGLLSSNTGRRQIQISHLKIKDIMTGKNRKGELMYLINVPRAKQRGATFRSEFSQFAVTKELWAILNMQVQFVTEQVKSITEFGIPDTDILELPLFPNISKLNSVLNLTELRQKLVKDELHIPSSEITRIVQKIARIANIHSERTGEAIEITSNRFRYTMGTRAAREGFGIMVIAELLDHSDTQNANVYIENIPEYAEKINQKVGHLLAPYAQAFAGVLVNSEKDAERGNDLNSRVGINSEGIGTCGSYGFCGARVPIPCYTCIHFQAWIDGPHQRVLDELISERDRIKEITGDTAVAAINDRTILAVMEVIRLCETRRKALNNG